MGIYIGKLSLQHKYIAHWAPNYIIHDLPSYRGWGGQTKHQEIWFLPPPFQTPRQHELSKPLFVLVSFCAQNDRSDERRAFSDRVLCSKQARITYYHDLSVPFLLLWKTRACIASLSCAPKVMLKLDLSGHRPFRVVPLLFLPSPKGSTR